METKHFDYCDFRSFFMNEIAGYLDSYKSDLFLDIATFARIRSNKTKMKRKFKPLEKWHGIDASNEISLFEYGILFRNTTEGLQVIYRWYYDEDKFRYSYGWFNADDFWCNDSWVDFGKLYEFSQTTMDFYIFNPEQFCSDLYGYYGGENIFGTDYSGGYTENEIRRILNKALNH